MTDSGSCDDINDEDESKLEAKSSGREIGHSAGDQISLCQPCDASGVMIMIINLSRQYSQI